MGNDQVKLSPYGNIYLQTDKSFYLPGDTITGTVYLNLVDEFPGSKVYLKIKGKEEATWYDEKGNYCKGLIIFYNHLLPLYENDNEKMNVGQYAFPFAFAIRDFLPGTYTSPKKKMTNKSLKGQIKYKLKAELRGNMPNDILKYTDELIIRDNLKSGFSIGQGSFIYKINNCFCIPRGVTQIKCFFEKNAYAIGENAKIFCEIDNSKCSLNLIQVVCELKNILIFKSDGGGYQKIENTIFTRKLEGVGKYKKAENDDKRKVTVKMEKEHYDGEDIQPTTSGQLLSCKYFLEVSIKFEDHYFNFKNFPQFHIPVTIYNSNEKIRSVKKPKIWEPIISDNKNLVIIEAYYYPRKNIRLSKTYLETELTNNHIVS